MAIDPPAAFFESVPRLTVGSAVDADWSDVVDAVYCISLQTRPDRMAAANAEINRVGLAPLTTFYRPLPHPERPVQGIWESHRAVARHALERGLRRVLILEDDIRFSRPPTAARRARLAAQLAALPADWNIFFLGHWPFRTRFVARDLVQVESACAHAYIASERMLRWLAERPFGFDDVALRRGAGKGIDSAYSVLPDCFAVFPMLVVQGASPSDHFAHLRNKGGRKLHHRLMRWVPAERYYAFGMRAAEVAAVARALPSFLRALLVRPKR
ncbi:MAG: hypothetical protein WBN86_08885 [Porticoccaceae bacterium]